MSAVARVWWTFFTAFPLQRWLSSIGAIVCGLLALGALTGGPAALWVGSGLLVLFVVGVFPTVFAAPAVLRGLSAPRSNQLLPHFRARMLAAVALFVAAVLVFFALLFFGFASPASRPPPLELLVYVFAALTALFLVMFLQFGDWRWTWLWIAAPVGLLGTLGLFSSAGGALPAIPAWAWLGVALAAWIAFAAWYVGVRRIRPVMLFPEAQSDRWSRANLEGITRESALRALVTAKIRRSQSRELAVGSIVGAVVSAVVIAALLSRAGRFFSFTSFIWPLSTMMLLWGTATSIVHRSRLLWLRMPGSREAVRREIERALLRNFGGRLLVLLGVAAIYASPLVAAAPLEVVAGFALAACAGLFGTYAALAAVPGGHPYVASFGMMIVIQLALLARTSPSLTAVGLVIAAQLGGAILFRVVAGRRWQRIDWLQLRPLPTSKT